MVDDTLVNLRAARRLGMRTVWVSAFPARRYVVAKDSSTVPCLLDDLATHLASPDSRTGIR